MTTSKVSRVAARALVSALFASVMIGFTASPSLAAGCFGTGCNGKDPNAMGCSATTAWYHWHDGGGSIQYSVELRKSADCGAVWGRIIKYDCYSGSRHWYVSIEHMQWTPYGWYLTRDGTATSANSYCDGGREWSYMRVYNSYDRYRVCIESRPRDDWTRPARDAALTTCWSDYLYV
jgi:hypothetical protein